MSRGLSRPKRWAAAVQEARNYFDQMVSCLEQIGELKDEYEEWQDNLPENMESSPLGEKLDEVANIDLEVTGEVEGLLDELEGIDLPRGFGRD